MTEELKKFIANYVSLGDAELDRIAGSFGQKVVRKHNYLLREGQVCKDIIFVQKGCLRLNNTSKDIETSVWFSFEHTSAIEIASFISGQPTSYFIQAIEDNEVLFLPRVELDKLYQTYPKMQEMDLRNPFR